MILMKHACGQIAELRSTSDYPQQGAMLKNNGHSIGGEGDRKEGDEALNRPLLSVSPSPSFHSDLCSQILKMETHDRSSVGLEDEDGRECTLTIKYFSMELSIQGTIISVRPFFFRVSWRRPTMPWRSLSARDILLLSINCRRRTLIAESSTRCLGFDILYIKDALPLTHAPLENTVLASV